ncbi:MAG: TonB-dependent receptor, partial [Gemmatimonadaceae bacterium]
MMACEPLASRWGRVLARGVMAVSCLVTSAAAQSTSAIIGVVVGSDERPVAGARVRARRSSRDDSTAREVFSDTHGAFRLDGLLSGTYIVSARRLGYVAAEMPVLRLGTAQTATLRVTLSATSNQLSAIVVVASPLTIEVDNAELRRRIDRRDISVLPTAHDASSLIALIPGARPNQLWGGAGAVANDYRIDGISFNHPGAGGDFVRLPVDWVEAIEVRGLGAGAEYGNFQGGVINAVTKTGGNAAHVLLRGNYESGRLTASNLALDELGSEQAGRRELSAQVLGPLRRDRLFYFLAGQHVDRDVRSPNLATAAADYLATTEVHRDDRILGKLTLALGRGDHLDALLGGVANETMHAGINGSDDPSALRRASSRTAVYQIGLTRIRDLRNTIELRIGGFHGTRSDLGYAGSGVPSVQFLQSGRQPSFQNAAFDERVAPSSVSGSAIWRAWRHLVGVDHHVAIGTELERAGWRDDRTRNGGLTWRPFSSGLPGINATDATTWKTTGSDWGGDFHVNSVALNSAVFVQDDILIGTSLTLSLGARYGRWDAALKPPCDSVCRPRFHVASAAAMDPRAGIVWDVNGRRDLTLKAHFGRYHQRMFPLFVDRAEGVNAYTNQRFYYAAPPLTDSRTVFTPAQRDALLADTTGNGVGFSSYIESILDESGVVDRYRQPYVDQSMASVEKTIGSRWKVEAMLTHRANGDIVGLVDRNRASNYSVLRNVSVRDRLGFGQVLDANRQPLVLAVVYIANKDLDSVLTSGSRGTPRVGPYTLADVPNLKFNPDVALTTIPEAKRTYDQATLSLRTVQPRWRADGSVTAVRMRGNVAGVTGFGTVGTDFSAGPFVRPNEATNFSGDLPDASHFEGKLWLAAMLPHSVQAGLIYTHVLGEPFTPTFTLNGRYRYSLGDTLLDAELFKRVIGQTIFVEPRGARHYASRTIVDAHVDWRPGGDARRGPVITFDVFNLTGSHALTGV